MSEFIYRQMAIGELTPYENNARKHSSDQIRQVANSLETFGFINPVVIDENRRILAGHARVLAAKSLGMGKVPTIRVDHLSDAELRAYMLADNKLAENACWDEDALRLELDYLSNIDFDVEITGFSACEIDILLEGPASKLKPISDKIPSVPDKSVVQPGDVFLIGDHRVICGDCRDPDIMEWLMENRQADLVCTDPPFNVPIKGHVLSKASNHAEFTVASGEMSSQEFTEFLRETMKVLYQHSRMGSVHYVFMDWRHISEITRAGLDVYDAFLNVCVWVKANGGMGSFYRSQHELVFVFRKGKDTHTNNVQLGKFGRNRTNVWSYAGMNSFHEERDEALASHPTVKPADMIADAIKDASKRGDLILDCFLGSGTSLVAAESVGRVCYGVEIEPRYVEVSIRRFIQKFGGQVVHLASGRTFEELVRERGGND